MRTKDVDECLYTETIPEQNYTVPLISCHQIRLDEQRDERFHDDTMYT